MPLPEISTADIVGALRSLGEARNLADAVWLRTGRQIRDEINFDDGRKRILTQAVALAQKEGWLEGMIRAAAFHEPKSVPLKDLLARMNFAPLPVDMTLPSRPVGVASEALHALIARRRPPMLLKDFTQRLAAISRSVCWIGLRGGDGQDDVQWGSGVLVAPDLVLTNYHVSSKLRKPAEAEPAAVVIRFDRLTGTEKGEVAELADEWCVAESPYAPSDVQAGGREPGSDELDFALLRLRRPPQRAHLEIAEEPPPLLKDDFIFVVQHPADTPDDHEGAQRIAVGRVLQFEAEGMRVQHDASATPGSSGSPAFTVDLRPAALHHGSEPLRDADGKIVARLRSYNRGIPLRPIIRFAKTQKGVPKFWKPTGCE